jgi:membrane-bound serine protease (ClpP class)
MGLLLVLAVLGFYIEYNNPGLIFPGLLGALCLIVFLYGTQLLPVNVFGVALIALGLVLFVLEVKFVSFGALTLAGGLCVGVGLYVLFDREVPGMQVPIKTIVLVVLALLAVVGLVTALVVKALRSKTTTGREGVIGETGQATSALDPTGTVFVHGEVWSAIAGSPIEKGRPVRVVAVEEGLRLRVEELSGGSNEGEIR